MGTLEAKRATRARVYLEHEQVERRWPRLLRAMRWAACLATTEATSCLVMHHAGHEYAGEAVNHYGGCVAVIRGAVRCRHAARRTYRAT
jgi:hypothetical protein